MSSIKLTAVKLLITSFEMPYSCFWITLFILNEMLGLRHHLVFVESNESG